MLSYYVYVSYHIDGYSKRQLTYSDYKADCTKAAKELVTQVTQNIAESAVVSCKASQLGNFLYKLCSNTNEAE